MSEQRELAKNEALIGVLRRFESVLARGEPSAQTVLWLKSEIASALAANATAPENPATVRVTFPDVELAESWMDYMSDGGGEYGFIESPDGAGTSFAYDRPGRTIQVTRYDQEAE